MSMECNTGVDHLSAALISRVGDLIERMLAESLQTGMTGDSLSMAGDIG